MALAIFATVVILGIVATILVRRYPFEIFVWTTRSNLKKMGLERKTLGDLVYWAGGSGTETLVLVHGTNDQAGTWAYVARDLVRQYRLIIPDLPGHGESAPATGPLDMKMMSAALARVIEAETAGQPITVVGNSMGGWTAMLYTFDHPQNVKHLVLEDSGGMTWDISKIPLVPQTREQAAAAMRLALGPTGRIPPAYVLDAMVRRGPTSPMLRLMQSNILPYLVDNRLGEIKAPVTMIWGDGDGLVPLEYAKVLQSRIANAKLHVIENCGHIPHRQKPQQFTTLVTESAHV